jgi:hypothetical protein
MQSAVPPIELGPCFLLDGEIAETGAAWNLSSAGSAGGGRGRYGKGGQHYIVDAVDVQQV